ncbi:DUF2017 family protein [Microbacterium abyssi]|uniref:DUF2017 family protein n=1 Tax=Microbacterium abyssi TaxID=2782166 RepID=UPI001887EC29|nr:DUF2017 family protein [Microbacterium sp. A18JL241]
MSVSEIRLSLAPIEGLHLAGLVDQLTDVIAAADDLPDPGVARLTPDPYPEDAEASAEFTTATRDDLLDRRTADAAVVRRALDAFVDDEIADDDESEDDEPDHIDVVIRRGELDSWLRTLTALRLVIATRLGITDDDEERDPDDPRFGVFDWLAFRLDGLIAIADGLDDVPEDD